MIYLYLFCCCLISNNNNKTSEFIGYRMPNGLDYGNTESTTVNHLHLRNKKRDHNLKRVMETLEQNTICTW